MNTPSDAIGPAAVGAPEAGAIAVSPVRRVYWLLRRELWENRSLYLVPLAVAVLIVAGFSIYAMRSAEEMRAAPTLSPAQQQELLQEPYTFASLFLMGISFLVAAFYCLEALYGERRDRSILFWKSLPVSDLTAVLSKASIPILLIPLFTIALTMLTHLLMLLLSMAALAGSDLTVASLWGSVSLPHLWEILFYHLLLGHGFWYAPLYGWLLLVSAWSRRLPFLWAILPLIGVHLLEKMAFGTSYSHDMLQSRLIGGPPGADFPMDTAGLESVTHLNAATYLSSPGLWIGLGVTAAFLLAAAWLRRQRGAA